MTKYFKFFFSDDLYLPLLLSQTLEREGDCPYFRLFLQPCSKDFVSFSRKPHCLKQLLTISLVAILVFNMFGYQFIVAYLQQQNSLAIETRIDKDQYNDSELISIKVSLNLPYYNGCAEFERTYGSVNIDGIDYEYVKRRVYKDTLELLCLANFEKTKLSTVSGEIAKGVAENGSQPAKKPITIKTLLPDYFLQLADHQFVPSSQCIQTYFSTHKDALPVNYSSSKDKPPQFVS